MSSKLTSAISCCRPSAWHGARDADRDQVLAREQRRGRVRAAEEVACGLIRVDTPKPRMPDQVEILSQAVLREGLAVPPQTLGGGVHLRAVAEETDPAVARGDQMGDGRARAAGVVGDHRVGVDEVRRAVDEGQRHPGRSLPQQVGDVRHGGRDDQAVDPARAERRRELAFSVGLLVGAADEREHATFARGVLDAAVHGSEEGVRDVLEDQADAGRLAVRAAQRARGQVVPVAEQRDGVADPLDEVAADALATVDDARDRAQAHARDGRDLAHGRPAAGPPLGGLHPHGADSTEQRKRSQLLTRCSHIASVPDVENVVWRVRAPGRTRGGGLR